MGIPNFQTDPYFGLSHLATFGSLLKISPARYTLFHKHHKPFLEKKWVDSSEIPWNTILTGGGEGHITQPCDCRRRHGDCILVICCLKMGRLRRFFLGSELFTFQETI